LSEKLVVNPQGVQILLVTACEEKREGARVSGLRPIRQRVDVEKGRIKALTVIVPPASWPLRAARDGTANVVVVPQILPQPFVVKKEEGSVLSLVTNSRPTLTEVRQVNRSAHGEPKLIALEWRNRSSVKEISRIKRAVRKNS